MKNKIIWLILLLITLQTVQGYTTGTEFIIPTNNTNIITQIFPNTTIYIDINNDNIIDYQKNIQNTEKIKLPWNIKQNSKIKSNKPIIFKQISKIEKNTYNNYEEYIFCNIPDITKLNKQYLLLKGTHIITPTIKNQIIQINNKTIKNIITINKTEIIKSKTPFISTNTICLDPNLLNETYTSENEITIIPLNLSQIEIDYNNDKIIDNTINISKETTLENIPKGAHFISNKNFTIIQKLKWFLYKNKEIVINSFQNPSKEKILTNIINDYFNINKNSEYKVIETSNNSKNEFTINTNTTKYFTNKSKIIGIEKSQIYTTKTILSINPNIIQPELTTVDFVTNQTTIRIFNPNKIKIYKFLKILLNTTSKTKTTINNLTTDEIIQKINYSKINEILPDTYIQITGNKINSYTIEYEEK